MVNKKADIKADIKDRSEAITMMEPTLVQENNPRRAALADLTVELATCSTGLRKGLPDTIANALSNLVRSMNCYYSNLIEGHDTHPVDIENALNEDYHKDPQKRDLQLEARAHIEVQKWIDRDGLNGPATSSDALLETHKRFYTLLPETMLWAEDKETGERIKVIPGQFRTQDVRVGQHIPVSPGAVPRFICRFEHAYQKLGKVDSIISAAAAHHRLLWIHPFLDGNGRVARLMSYAIIREVLDTGGIWSIARGLARNEANYKRHLIACDLPRRNDLDGRGNLSEEALAEFITFFLNTCIDQVRFMETLIQPQKLRDRIMIWAEEEIRARTLPPKSNSVLIAILYRGDLPRSDVVQITNGSERTARRITSTLLQRGILTSASPRSPLCLAFPATLASRWMPGLFPEKAQD